MPSRLAALTLGTTLLAACAGPQDPGGPALLGGSLLTAVGGTVLAVSSDPRQCSDDEQLYSLGACQPLEDWTSAKPYGFLALAAGLTISAIGLGYSLEYRSAVEKSTIDVAGAGLLRAVLNHAAAGRCERALDALRALRLREPAAAASAELDDDVRACRSVPQEAR